MLFLPLRVLRHRIVAAEFAAAFIIRNVPLAEIVPVGRLGLASIVLERELGVMPVVIGGLVPDLVAQFVATPDILVVVARLAFSSAIPFPVGNPDVVTGSTLRRDPG